ncbi:hypothetical protein H072_10680 [Dactylellina haptotyla CBS 200.50]|uniref:Uncharacterized protein n=1 Tax=Dactylellina haptotyla (strain CBS 200.50) TaxID=1284197 RepID=S8BKV6_DACHA|nr:hypothetical protein H072_10680 [Dactylellina haptotyla CBS 200.50]
MDLHLNDEWATSAVFSPSRALQQQHQAKEWSFVDQWLQQKYHPRSVPVFERNTETLKVLTALANANEAADEERALRLEFKQNILTNYKPKRPDDKVLRIREGLNRDAVKALDSIAGASVKLGVDSGSIPQAREALLYLTKEECEVEHAILPEEQVLKNLVSDIEEAEASLRKHQSDAYETPKDLPARLAEWTRTIKILQQKSAEYKDRAVSLQNAYRRNQPKYTVESLVELETEVLDFQGHVRSLNGQVKAYTLLPPDPKAAQRKIEEAKQDLENLRSRRDEVYQGMARA